MKIVVDIVHPADVLFFLNPIRQWQRWGHQVFVASRRKDVTVSLLDAFSIDHTVVSSAGTNLPGLALELVRRDIAMLRFIRKHKPDVLVGFGGVAISHAGKLLGLPSVSFYDTERAPLQLSLTLPFISHFYVPDSYDGPIARNRTHRFRGTKDLSYFHPDNFAPDKATALTAGLVEGERNYFIRLVGWKANHDIGYAGWDARTLERFVGHLSTLGKVHISSEAPLPASMESLRYRGGEARIHHLLAHCTCYIGESATMAAESALLGVPAVYAATDRRCYTEELAAQGLLITLTQVDYEALCRATAQACVQDRTLIGARLTGFMRDKVNLADYVAETVLRHAREGC